MDEDRMGTIEVRFYMKMELVKEELILCARKPTLEQLNRFAEWAIEVSGRSVVLDPVNPGEVKLLQTKAVIRTYDDVAIITQQLGGVPSRKSGHVNGSMSGATEYGLEVYGSDIMY